MHRKEKKDKRNEEIERLQKELDEFVENSKLVTGESNINNINLKDILNNKNHRLRNFFIELALSIVLLISLSGYIKWITYDSIWFLFITILGIVGIETIINIIINKFFIKLIIYSFGLCKILSTVIAFTIAGFFAPKIEFNNLFIVILVMIIYIVIKRIVMGMFRQSKVKIIWRK